MTDGARTFPLPDNFIVNAKKEEVNAALQAAFDTILDIEAELLSELGAGGLAKLQRVLRRLAPED